MMRSMRLFCVVVLLLLSLLTLPSLPPVVILPGFGNADIDYVTPLNQPSSSGLVSALERRGFGSVTVLELKRWEWIKVGAGLVDPKFWSGDQLPTGIAYGWYVKRARETILESSKNAGGEKVIVIAHSAGGWLARSTLGDGTDWDSSSVQSLVTLGAPHYPPPEGSPPCATRGALKHVSENLPGAFLSGVSYVTVAGSSISGSNEKRQQPTTDADEIYAKRGEGSAARVAYANYNALAGDGTLFGDGVIPVKCAHLPGATQITIENAIHSINEAGTALPTERWYGSEGVVDEWLKPVLGLLGVEMPKAVAEQVLSSEAALEVSPTVSSASSVIIDVNNAVAREFSSLPGCYPTIATKLIKRGPFSNKKEMYAALDSDAEVERLKQYDKNLKIAKRDPGIMQFKESQIFKYEGKATSDYQNQQMKQIQSERRY
ncbi:hypothetical protein TrVE_jg9694 [Triparma verrucosa]|uniref:GPI inositol-deacylase n=1 Tax=Triparma verrucosa TaxID=1606542 RepID=A0A9W7FCH6_9STRA|nr:hypothetical protein TrVE_jg9694 [Triparma verrucosa]